MLLVFAFLSAQIMKLLSTLLNKTLQNDAQSLSFKNSKEAKQSKQFFNPP